MMKRTLPIIFFSTVVMSMTNIAQASNAPSILETQEFIVARTNVERDTGFETYYTRVSFPEKCVVQLRDKTVNNESGSFTVTYTKIELNKLDPREVDIGDYGAFLTTTDKKKIIRSRVYNTKKDNKKNYNWCLSMIDKAKFIYNKSYMDGESCVVSYDDFYMTLPTTNENKPRIAKAARHLIKECGGKSPLF